MQSLKIKICYSVVKTVLLYGSKWWCDIQRVDTFHNSCLRKICLILWPEKVSNVELCGKTKCNSTRLEIEKRQLKWVGKAHLPKVALHWKPPGKQNQGRVKTMWHRTILAEARVMGHSWDKL